MTWENPKWTPLSFVVLSALDDSHPLLSDRSHDTDPGTNIRNLS